MTLTPADLRETVGHCRSHLDDLVQRDWDVMVPGLDWNVRMTAEHLVDVVGFYTIHLAARTRQRLRIDVSCHDGLSNVELVDILGEMSRGLAGLPAVTPSDVRVFHLHGTTDVSGLLALACVELLIHTHDIGHGLGAPLLPLVEISGKVARRLFPAAPPDKPLWRTLLWATGRETLPGYPDVGDDWVYHPTPQDG